MRRPLPARDATKESSLSPCTGADGLSHTKTAAGSPAAVLRFALLEVVFSSVAGVAAVAALCRDERETHARKQ